MFIIVASIAKVFTYNALIVESTILIMPFALAKVILKSNIIVHNLDSKAIKVFCNLVFKYLNL